MPFPPEFHELAEKVKNWGRWGADDELGTLNLITPEVVLRGVAA
ncbi:MAG: cyclase, partial [Actinomycetia bacterium]|nr:cyclase [Actinomycetes bacterium]